MPFDINGLDDTNGASTRFNLDVPHMDIGLNVLTGAVAVGAVAVVSHRTPSVADNTEVSAVFPLVPDIAGIQFRLIDAFIVKRVGAGAAGDQVIITRNGTTVAVITLNVADTAVGRAFTIDDAEIDFIASNALGLHFDLGGGGNNACDVHMMFKRIA